MRENIRNLTFRKDLTLFGPYIQTAVQISFRMDLNNSIVGTDFNAIWLVYSGATLDNQLIICCID